MLLRWAQKAFHNFSVVPPSTGIVHQVNIEYLARVVQLRPQGDEHGRLPGHAGGHGLPHHHGQRHGRPRLGRGRASKPRRCCSGQPLYLLAPEVIGFRLHGQLPEGTTATDLVLMVTQMLRKHGVVGKFVEFYGPGLSPADPGRPGHPVQHGPGVRRHRLAPSRWTSRRCSTSAAPGARRSWSPWWSATPKSRACSARTTSPAPSSARCCELDLVDGRAQPRRARAPARPGQSLPGLAELPLGLPAAPGRRRGRGPGDRAERLRRQERRSRLRRDAGERLRRLGGHRRDHQLARTRPIRR